MPGIAFTSETAAFYARRAVAARVARIKEEKASLERLTLAVQVVPLPTPLSERIRVLQAQIDDLDVRIGKVKDARDLAALHGAKERAMDNMSRFDPAYCKPSPRKGRNGQQAPFVPPIPQPAPPQAAQLPTPTPPQVVSPPPSTGDNTTPNT